MPKRTPPKRNRQITNLPGRIRRPVQRGFKVQSVNGESSSVLEVQASDAAAAKHKIEEILPQGWKVVAVDG